MEAYKSLFADWTEFMEELDRTHPLDLLTPDELCERVRYEITKVLQERRLSEVLQAAQGLRPIQEHEMDHEFLREVGVQG